MCEDYPAEAYHKLVEDNRKLRVENAKLREAAQAVCDLWEVDEWTLHEKIEALRKELAPKENDNG